MRTQRHQLSAADDGQRMLLRCILHDALYWDYRVTDACPACRAIGDLCAAHWDEHEARRAVYHTLADHLESYEGSAGACPLTAQQRQIIAAALAAAVAYRRGRHAAEDTALLSAYRSLRRRFPAPRHAPGARTSLATGTRPRYLVTSITTAGRS
jgi:hypothetical protein